MPIVPLTPLATPPDPNDRSTFDARAYPFTVSQQTMVGEFNANVPALNDAATAASGALAASHYKGAWSTLTGPLAIPATVVHNGSLYMLLESVADVTAEVPGVSANWKALAASPLERKPRTANTQLAAGDAGSWIDITANSFAQTFAAAAILGAGWWCYLRNSGTGDITLDPNGAELIDGLTSYVMYPGETRLVQCDGTTLRTVVVQSFHKTFTASGNFIKPPGYSMFDSLTWSAGSSGQKSGGTGLALGGGGGGCFPARIPAGVLPSTVAITVGAGGVARTTASVGAVGGDSSIGTLIVVCQQSSPERGGSVRLGVYVASTAGAGVGDFGVGSAGATPCLYGGGGSASGTDAGPGIYGAGAGGMVENNSALRDPGTSVFGGAGGAAGDAVSGTDGVAPGGGGGGTRTGTRSGAGARGEVRIWGVL